jgi:hypothetical protein
LVAFRVELNDLAAPYERTEVKTMSLANDHPDEPRDNTVFVSFSKRPAATPTN